MRNKMLIAIFMSVLLLGVGHTDAFAKCGKGDRSCSKGRSCEVQKSCKKSSLCAKFCKKVSFLMANSSELGLTDQQVTAIKALNSATKKSIIEHKAKIDVLKIDIKDLMYERTVNLETINPLIDQKYELKKAKTKTVVAAIGSLKNILTDEQYAEMKKMWKEKAKSGNCPRS